MRRLLTAIVVLLSFVFAAPVISAAPVPVAPKIKAKGFLLLDHHSGRVLAEKNADGTDGP